MGRICEKHQEYFETECRWCEPAVTLTPFPFEPLPPFGTPEAKAERERALGPTFIHQDNALLRRLRDAAKDAAPESGLKAWLPDEIAGAERYLTGYVQRRHSVLLRATFHPTTSFDAMEIRVTAQSDDAIGIGTAMIASAAWMKDTEAYVDLVERLAERCAEDAVASMSRPPAGFVTGVDHEKREVTIGSEPPLCGIGKPHADGCNCARSHSPIWQDAALFRPKHRRPFPKLTPESGGVSVEFGYRSPQGCCPSFASGTTPEQAREYFEARATRAADDRQRLIAELHLELDKLQRRIAGLCEEAKRHAVHGEEQ